jgi:hypothetical protein
MCRDISMPSTRTPAAVSGKAMRPVPTANSSASAGGSERTRRSPPRHLGCRRRRASTRHIEARPGVETLHLNFLPPASAPTGDPPNRPWPERDVFAAPPRPSASARVPSMNHPWCCTVAHRGKAWIVLDEDMQRVVGEQRSATWPPSVQTGRRTSHPKPRPCDDDHLVFAHLHSPRTVANIEAGNPVIRSTSSISCAGTARARRQSIGTAPSTRRVFVPERSGLEPHRIEAIVLIRVDALH